MPKDLLVLYRFSLDANPVKQAAFEKAYREYKAALGEMEGYLDEMLVRSLHTPTDYLIISRWVGDGFVRWLQSPEHDEIVQILNRFGRSNPQAIRYTVETLFTK